MVTKPASPIYYSSATGGLTTTTADTIAPALAGFRNFLTCLQFANKSATASEIVVMDNTTVIWRGYAPASAGSVAHVTFDPPLQTSVNSPLKVGMITTATATVISGQGFVDP